MPYDALMRWEWEGGALPREAGLRDTSDADDPSTDGHDVAEPAREPRQGAGPGWPLARREQHEERRHGKGRQSGHTPIFGGD
jgi:hypothetical protein